MPAEQSRRHFILCLSPGVVQLRITGCGFSIIELPVPPLLYDRLEPVKAIAVPSISLFLLYTKVINVETETIVVSCPVR